MFESSEWIPHGALLYMDPRYWLYANQFQSASEPVVNVLNATVTPTWPQKCFGGLNCVRSNGSIVFVDPSTRFFTHCFLSAFGFIWAMIFLVPMVTKIRELTLFHGERKATARGQIAGLAAAWAPVLALLQMFSTETSVVPLDFVFIALTLVAAVLHRVQDGRVAVCSQELYCFWLGESFVYVGLAINELLLNGIKSSWLQLLSAFCAIIALGCELRNPERDPKFEYDDFSLFSKVMINFAEPVLAKCVDGYEVSQRDFPNVPFDTEANECTRVFSESLAKYLGDYNHSEEVVTEDIGRYKLFRALVTVAGKNMALNILFSLLDVACSLYKPFVMIQFLRLLVHYQNGETELYRAYYTAIQFALVPLTGMSLETLAFIQGTFSETKVRCALLVSLYRKAMALSPKARESFEASTVMNLMNVDAQQVLSLTEGLGLITSLPVMIVLTVVQLWHLLGYTFLAAAMVYAVVIPAQTVMATKIAIIVPSAMKLIDKRTKVTSNLLRSIKSLKLYAWEKPFLKHVAVVRAEQLAFLRGFIGIEVFLTVIFNTMSDFTAVAVFTFFLYYRQGVLSAEVVFPVFFLLQLISLTFVELPIVVVSWSQGITSCGRLFQFLAQKDNLRENYEHLSEGAVGDDFAVRLQDATVSWNGDTTEEKMALKNVSFEAHRGDFVCIVGRVGSGKTALLRTLCGELSILDGDVVLKGGMSYSPQDPWLQNMTVQENVLFGQVLDQEWYDQVIDACELVRDIEDMPQGHQTEVGERGITLSGGQKARLGLARAVYSRSDIILLDDVLSAVDEHVSKALIAKLFDVNGLLANRTILLATNNIKVLSYSSRIIALADKQVAEVLSFDEVVRKGESSLIYKLVKEFGGDLTISGVNRRDALKQRAGLRATTSEVPAEYTKFDVYAKKSDEEDEKTVSSLEPFIRYYFKSGNNWIIWPTIIFMLTTVVCRTSVITYLGVIASYNFKDLYSARWQFTVYIGLTITTVVFLCLNLYFMNLILGIRNSQNLHDQMMWATLRAPMSFFDKTPFGRILNRFTGDLNSVDNRFAEVGQRVFRSALNVVVALVPVIFGAPQILLIVVPLGWWANSSRVKYVPAQRKVTRIYAAANSPLLSHVEDTLKGRAIVSTFGQTQRFEEIFLDYANYWGSACFFRRTLGTWLQVRIRLMSLILEGCSALGVTQLIGWHIIGASFAGVVLNFAERIGVFIGQTITAVATAEVTGVSLERILEYVDMPQEAPYHIDATEPAPEWPSKGEIVFDDMSARYTEDSPLVLKHLSLKVNSGEKIGVVGRTGSGKSTLTLTIFRLLEACEGDIEMDNIDTSVLGLGDLRSRLSIVPQDAQIFDSSVRDNLDPLHTVDDARLWEVLDLCHLKEHFERLDGLDTVLTDGGSQLSRGQAQLLCLGRALVHKAKVLVLDEATASVDHKTDKIIQETIRKHMFDRTVITVAHRLNTIMDSDRVLVLDRGEIKEFDTPQRLLEAKGLFYSMHNTEQKEDDSSEEHEVDE